METLSVKLYHCLRGSAGDRWIPPKSGAVIQAFAVFFDDGLITCWTNSRIAMTLTLRQCIENSFLKTRPPWSLESPTLHHHATLFRDFNALPCDILLNMILDSNRVRTFVVAGLMLFQCQRIRNGHVYLRWSVLSQFVSVMDIHAQYKCVTAGRHFLVYAPKE